MKLPVSDIITTGINIKFVIFISILRCNEEHFLQDKNDLLLSLDTEGSPDPTSIKVMKVYGEVETAEHLDLSTSFRQHLKL